MFHGLMGGAIFAEADGVMGHHIDHALAHEGREANAGAAVISEDQEGAAIGNDAAMQRHAVHGGGHAMLANAVVDIARAVVGGVQGFHVLGFGIVGTGEIGGAADGFGHGGVDHIKGVLRCVAGGDPWRIFCQFLFVGGNQLHQSSRARHRM